MQQYNNLFSECRIGRKIAKNRIVMSPMGDNMANTDGSISEQSLAYYTERAKGGAAIIIPGVVSVDYPRGKTVSCQHRLDGEKYVKDWARLARNIHRYGALLIPQLHHAGSATNIMITEGVPLYKINNDEINHTVPGARSNKDAYNSSDYHIMTHDDIINLENKFIYAARLAQKAGCDGVELHGVAYLLCEFFTPYMNHRTDEYGGSLENRVRIAINIIKGIRKECGDDFIIGIRMPVHNWETDGLSDEESIKMAQMFENAGCDFLDANGGYPPTISCLLETDKYPQGDRVCLARKIKPHVNIPVFTVGNLREPEFCENVLASGDADFVMLGRALLADPYWPKKAQKGSVEEIRKCISCLDACRGALDNNTSFRCVLNPKVGFESEMYKEPPAIEHKKIVIIGGGLAGMQAAITATERGHEVIILEKSERLGGQMHLANKPLYKEKISWAIEWFVSEVMRKHIEVIYNTEADINIIKSYNPDTVFLATGSVPWAPNIPGIEKGVFASDLLSGKVAAPQNKKVVIIGGGMVGCEVALWLREKGNSVTIIEMKQNIAEGLVSVNKNDLIREINEKNIDILVNAKVESVSDNKIMYQFNDEQKELDSDFVVLSLGQKSIGNELMTALKEIQIPFEVIGDAKKPGKFIDATTSGFFAALNA